MLLLCLLAALPATAITGVVLDENGKPLAKVHVAASWPGVAKGTPPLASAITDGYGVYALPIEGHGEVSVDLAEPDSFAEAIVQNLADAVPGVLILHAGEWPQPPQDVGPPLQAVPGRLGGGPTLTLRGVVRDAQKYALGGIEIWLLDAGGRRVAVTDAQGRFAISGVQPGRQPIGINAWTYDAENAQGRASEELVIEAKPRPIVAGIVKDADGNAVAAATILARPAIDDDDDGSQPGFNAIRIGATDAVGRFTLRVPRGVDPALPLILMAGRHGMPLSLGKRVPRRGVRDVVLQIPKGFAIRGRVMAAGKPLAGVRVLPYDVSRSSLFDGASPASSWATTDSSGNFSGRLVAGQVTLSFEKDGFVSGRVVVVPGPKTPLIDVALEPLVRISGRVTKHDGTPAKGAIVRLKEFAGEEVVTGADGKFSLQATKGPVELSFGTSREMVGRVVNAPVEDVTLVLPAVGSLHGRVMEQSTGTPVTSFTVNVGSQLRSGPPVWKQIQSADGSFVIEELPAGTAFVSITSSGFLATVKQDIAVEEGKDTDAGTIALSRGRTVRGRVTTADHKPADDTSISVESQRGTRSNSDGSYEVPSITSEAGVVKFQKEGYLMATRPLPAGESDATIDVELAAGLTLRGHVVDGAGLPVAEASVEAWSPAHDANSASAATDTSGVFTMKGLAAAHYLLAAEAPPDREGMLDDVDAAHAGDVTIRIAAKPHATIVGTVSGTAGSWVVQRVFAANDKGESAMADIDVEGKYRIADAPTGSVSVKASMWNRGGGRSSLETKAEVPPGSETRVDLAVLAGVAVRGRVTRGGSPVPGAMVTFQSSDLASGAALTSATGEYEIADLSPLHYIVTVTWPMGLYQTECDVAGGKPFDIVVDLRTMRFRVIDGATGEPIQGADLIIQHDGRPDGWARTDAAGVATLTVSPAGAKRVIVQMHGYGTLRLPLPESEAPIDVRLVRTEGILVRIVDARDGTTLSGTVSVLDDDDTVLVNGAIEMPDGAVRMEVAAGKYRFSATVPGYEPQTVQVRVPGGEVRIALKPEGK